jgi:hypothetical protein
MRTFGTILLAFFGSVLVAGLFAQTIAVWSSGTEEYIVVFMEIAPAALIGIVIYLIASFRPDPLTAMRRVTIALVVLLGLPLLGFEALSLYDKGTLQSALSEMAFLLAVFGTVIVVAVVQWVIFRYRTRAAPPAMLFGRGPGSPA